MSNIAPRRDEPIIDGNGHITPRFAQYLESMSRTVIQQVETVPDEIYNSVAFTLQAQVGSDDPLTSDETGFTVDSTALTVDMTLA